MIAYFAYYDTKYTFQDIGVTVYWQPNSISKTLGQDLKLAATNNDIRLMMITIELALSVSDMDRWVI